ncbi:MAG: protein-L-isoaspartate(D-aspartate) O-methyltransferase [Flavobacteriales bacterium]|nr:protein-L-isoaspartate(D-aspartate) O-methyltransferase [Flavobacteriales bacterium]MDG1780325.1 protein-L-isoaspartate(D-aspartate) O-methyltransferase [Flavobacteriales bacterium]
MEFVDTYRHKGLRKQLLEDLRVMGIKDERVLEAMFNIPRHYFLTSAFLEFAYDNKAFQIGAGQTISQPFTVAKQTELLELKRGDKVLEIGTGSGYQTCVLCELGAKVWSIERQRLLYDKTSPLIKSLGYRPNLYYGDGYKGKAAFAPFDKIIVTCGAPFVPEALLEQLKVGGKLIIPVGEGATQVMFELQRTSERDFTRKEHGDFAFVPMLTNRSKTR